MAPSAATETKQGKALSGKRTTFLKQYYSIVGESGVQNQTVNGDRSDAYHNIARALVLCFGVDDPLSNDDPDLDYWDLPYASIPAANAMPALDEEQSKKRDMVIEGLVQRVRNYYKGLRHKAKNTGGKASLEMKHIERITAAFADPPKMPKALDVYQADFKSHYLPSFDLMWRAKESEAAGDATQLERLKNTRGGQERIHAKMRWEQEGAEVRQKVQAAREKKFKAALAKYNALWGAPAFALKNSRAWVMPEAGAFLRVFLEWMASRFGVALALTIAGQGDKGEPDARTIFAAGDTKDGSPTLDEYAADATDATKVRLMQYVTKMMTGLVATGPSVNVSEDETEEPEESGGQRVDADAAAHALQFKEELANEPMTLVDEAGASKWAIDDTLLFGPEGPYGRSADRDPMHVDDARSARAAGADVQFNGHDGTGGSSRMTETARASKGKEKATDITITDDSDEDFGGELQALDGNFEEDAVVDPEIEKLRDAFSNNDVGLNMAMATASNYIQKVSNTRASSPATSASVRSDYDDGARSLASGIDDEDLPNYDPYSLVDEDNDEADIDAFLTATYVDRRKKKKRESSPRTILLGGVSRTHSGQSRKREPKLPAEDVEGRKEGEKSDEDSATGSGERGKKTARTARMPAPTKASKVVSIAKKAAVRSISEAQSVPDAQGAQRQVGVHTANAEESSAPKPKPKPRMKRRLRVTSPELGEDGLVAPQTTVTTGEGIVAEDIGMTDAGSSAARGLLDDRAADLNADDVDKWINKHTDPQAKAEGEVAWKTYIGTNGPASKRRALCELVRLVPSNLRGCYTNMVDAMEGLLRMDELWDGGKGGHLDKTKRPKEVTTMISGRGTMLSTPVPDGWGAQMAAWWISLQPSERGNVTDIRELSAPTADMVWDAVGECKGYKGAFLLVWSMMHWAKTQNDLELWRAVAEDMTRVFRIIQASRAAGDGRSPVPDMARGNGAKRPGAGSVGEEARPKKLRRDEGATGARDIGARERGQSRRGV
ncbi:unnamed protein product [Peniophora sp. CBMAI 1063]|nr:unnamed protein product [Peniophora sp. CBMAI 1063]